MATGILYWWVVGLVSVFAAMTVLFDVSDGSVIGVGLSVPLFASALFFSLYGLYLLALGDGAPVNENPGEYLLPMLRILNGTGSGERVNDPTSGNDRSADSPVRRDSDVMELDPLVCASCSVEVQNGAGKCPSCGYYPKRAIVASGLTYVGIGTLLMFGWLPIPMIAIFGTGLELDAPFWFAVALVITVIGLVVGFSLATIGNSMAFDGRNATVTDDYDEYRLPVIW